MSSLTPLKRDQLKYMPTTDLLKFVDRSHVEVKELALRLELIFNYIDALEAGKPGDAFNPSPVRYKNA